MDLELIRLSLGWQFSSAYGLQLDPYPMQTFNIHIKHYMYQATTLERHNMENTNLGNIS